MTRFFATVLLGGFLLLGSDPALAQAVCGTRTSLLKQLHGSYNETPVAMGLAANGSVVEVTRSETGTWTILLTNPRGLTCLMAAGEHWEAVALKPKGEAS